MTSEIELKRKELEDIIKSAKDKIDENAKEHYNSCIHSEMIRIIIQCENELKGFNLGVEMGKAEGEKNKEREFLNFLENDVLIGVNNKSTRLVIEEKVEELKQSIKEGEKHENN